MASITFSGLTKKVTLKDGTTYEYASIEAKDGKPTFLFLHGFPSSSHDWRYQVSSASKAGYGVVVPDLLGYGNTDKPDSLKQYDVSAMSHQIAELLDNEGLDKVIGVGHDWGSGLLSGLAMHHQDRFSLFIFCAVGYIPDKNGFRDIDGANKQVIAAIGRPTWGYWKFFNRPDAGPLINEKYKAHPECFTSLVYSDDPAMWIDNLCVPGGLDDWIAKDKTTQIAKYISKEDLDTHIKVIREGGIDAPLKWYKQAMSNDLAGVEETPPESARHISVPTLFVGCEKDYICVPALFETMMHSYVKDLTVTHLDTSHWVMLEKPDELWSKMQHFVQNKL